MPFTIILKGINRKFKQSKYYNIILEVRYLSRCFTKMMNTLTVKGVSGDNGRHMCSWRQVRIWDGGRGELSLCSCSCMTEEVKNSVCLVHATLKVHPKKKIKNSVYSHGSLLNTCLAMLLFPRLFAARHKNTCQKKSGIQCLKIWNIMPQKLAKFLLNMHLYSLLFTKICCTLASIYRSYMFYWLGGHQSVEKSV